ncbi:MAG TPA: siderophore-interacting protein [Baekduia sp.]|uniref:siderophore-interacting protein n=1 Tax=Baekduia sp. TaxID=2600305 RepID=UPI002D786938|nr:siderophore-interacting protein [Baekduia sp.]HET6510174.1 siderophore-interacting protein [Baekduia sp.]
MAEPAAFPAPPRRDRSPRLAHVVSTARVSPHLVRVVLGGEGLAGFGAGEFTDHYVKLHLPPQGADYRAPFDAEVVKASHPREHWPRTRTYTVRAWDAERGELTIDFVVHGDEGVAGPWALAAQPGDPIQLNGPGGAYAPDPDADWHLLVGDLAVLPAISAALPRIPAGVPAHVLIEAAPEDRAELESPADLRVTWVEPGGLPAAVEALAFPAGRVHPFVHGEASDVRAIRRHLLVDRGVAKEGISISGYWKRTRTEEGWREDKQEWNRQVEADLTAG